MNLIETAYQEVGADRDPDLGVNRVLTRSVKRLDSEVLFDPFEKEFDPPPMFIDRGDYQCGQLEVIGQEG